MAGILFSRRYYRRGTRRICLPCVRERPFAYPSFTSLTELAATLVYEEQVKSTCLSCKQLIKFEKLPHKSGKVSGTAKLKKNAYTQTEASSAKPQVKDVGTNTDTLNNYIEVVECCPEGTITPTHELTPPQLGVGGDTVDKDKEKDEPWDLSQKSKEPIFEFQDQDLLELLQSVPVLGDIEEQLIKESTEDTINSIIAFMQTND